MTLPGRGARAAAALGAAAALALCYLLYESQWLRVVEHVLELPDLPPDLDGFTVVQLSDLHAGSRPSFNMRAVRKAVDETRRIGPDLIVITGDLVTGASRLDELCDELRRLPESCGVFAVLGNHDHGVMKLVKAPPVDLSGLGAAGVRLLTDECVSVAVGAATLQVCGVDDVVNGYGHIEPVLGALDRTRARCACCSATTATSPSPSPPTTSPSSCPATLTAVRSACRSRESRGAASC